MASGQILCELHPLGASIPASNGCARGIRNGHDTLDFDGTTDQEAVFKLVLPDAYSGGGLTVLLRSAAATATTGTYRYQADIERLQVGTLDIDADSFTGTFQSAGVATNGTSGVTTEVSIAFTSGAQMDSLAAGETFRLKIRRDADGTSGTDDMTGLLQFVSGYIKET